MSFKDKKRSLWYLEQVCERYAIMAYEVFTGEYAYGFKSIEYSYKIDEKNGVAYFLATFVPFGEFPGTKPSETIIVRATAIASGEPDGWLFQSATVGEKEEEPWTIRFNQYNRTIVLVRPNNSLAYAGDGPGRSVWDDPSDPATRESLYV